MADASRARMFAEAVEGAGDRQGTQGAEGKVLLSRGCDPVMMERAPAIMGPYLGGCKMIGCTNDDDFVRLLTSGQRFDVVFFAPGACRWSAAKQPIPGGNSTTRGWGIDEYKRLVAQHHPEARIVETTEESKMVPLLRAALDLQ